MWSGKYAGQADMEDVLSQDFAPEEVGMVTSLLGGKGIPYKVNGSRVQVPADRKAEAFADITFAQILPHDTAGAYEDIINRMTSPIDSGSKTEAIQNHAKEVSLAQIIRYFPKVRSAMVSIDPTMKRGFGTEGITPSATVSIQLKAGEKFDKRLVEAAADVVSGGVAAIERKKIKVIIDGASHAVDDPDDSGFAGGSLLDRIRESETYYSQIVQNTSPTSTGRWFTSPSSINDEKTQIEETDYDPKKVAKGETSIKTRTEETTSITRGPADPGLNANTGLPSPAAPPPVTSRGTTVEETITAQMKSVRADAQDDRNPSRQGHGQSASVTLPRSYFAKIYQRNYQTDKEPADGVLMPFIDKQLPAIRAR